jgi:hypothetical protein
MRTRSLVGPILLIVLSLSACERSPAPETQKPTPERVPTSDEAIAKRKADVAESERASKAYLAKLADAVKAEATNETWAAQKTKDVRASFAKAGMSAESLRSLECKSTLCSAEIVLPAKPMSGPYTAPDLVLQWLTQTEPCAFATAPAERDGKDGQEVLIQVYINCGVPEAAKTAQ